jgi:DNA-binding IclR family transcriptional regulator
MDKSDSQAPALDQGLTLLMHLAASGSKTVEELCQTFAWPRSSLLRLLHTLVERRCVVIAGRPARCHALRGLTPIGTPLTSIIGESHEILQTLANNTGCSAELFHLNATYRHFELLATAAPQQHQIAVRAPLGSQISLTLAEAPVVAVLAAQGTEAPDLLDSKSRQVLTSDAVKKLLEQAQAVGWSAITQANRYGVLRSAAVIRDPHDNILGAVSLAQVASDYHPFVPADLAQPLLTMQQQLESLLREL